MSLLLFSKFAVGKMKCIIYSFWLIIPVLFILGCKTKEAKPNIVFIFADDMTFDAVHALGNDGIITPNLDRLVNQGTTFSNVYNMGGWNGAICVASRAMIISGRTIWNANQFQENWVKQDSLALEQTWPKLMEKAGYKTFMSGKWHVQAPADKVFQYVGNVRPGMPRDNWDFQNIRTKLESNMGIDTATDMPVGYNRPIEGIKDSWSPYDTSFGGYWDGGEHWSEVLKNDAVKFIDNVSNTEDPFFMYLAFNAPHDPRQAPKKFVDLYPLDDIKLPPNWQPSYPGLNAINGGRLLRDEALAPFPRTDYAVKKHIQEYYAIITHMDEQIGAIISALELSGKMDNTIIIFTADHGLAVGKHGFLGKQNLYDHSIRVPLVFFGKDIPKGGKIDADVYLQDVMATSLDWTFTPIPEYVEFHSLKKLISGSSEKSHYPLIYGAYTSKQRMIKKDEFKLIVYPELNKMLLFNLKQDRFEMEDLSENPDYQDIKNQLMKNLIEEQKRLNDTLNLSYMLDQFF